MTEPLLGVSKSLTGRAWVRRWTDENAVSALRQQNGLDDLTAQLLAGRDICPEQAQTYLKPKLRSFLPDPSSLTDMDKAVSLIVDAVTARRKVTVFADYDVDGATSAAQLVKWARHFGAEFSIYVPDRIKEGYGPSIEAFREIAERGTELIITVDCGAAAETVLTQAVDLAPDIVVFDHHIMPRAIPPCAALVNPNRHDDQSGLGYLAAAGVSFMCLAALNREARRRGLGDGPDLLSFLDLAALGTICDVVPLQDLNRALVAQGLKVMNRQANIGLLALSDIADIAPPYSTYHGGFVLGPRINAGGRIGKSFMGAELLSTENSQLAYGHAAELDRVNRQRRQMQDDTLRECLDMMSGEEDSAAPIVLASENWHPGIVGIVAGRLKDMFNRPAIVIGLDSMGLGKGSGRSLSGVNLGDAVIAADKADIIMAGGGHAMAAGMTLRADQVDGFREFLTETLSPDIKDAQAQSRLKIDSLLSPRSVGPQLIDVIEAVGPYGAGNPKPLFVLADMRVTYAKSMRGGHVRCRLQNSEGLGVDAVCFRAEESGLAKTLLSGDGEPLHAAVNIRKDVWQGRERIETHIVDIAKPS